MINQKKDVSCVTDCSGCRVWGVGGRWGVKGDRLFKIRQLIG